MPSDSYKGQLYRKRFPFSVRSAWTLENESSEAVHSLISLNTIRPNIVQIKEKMSAFGRAERSYCHKYLMDMIYL